VRTFALKFEEPKISIQEDILADSLYTTIKDRLVAKGYKYVTDPQAADMLGVIEYHTTEYRKYYSRLNVNLRLYAGDRLLLASSATHSLHYQDSVAQLLRPLVEQLTLRIPYAEHVGGIGVVISRELKIVGFTPYSPAQKAGLKLKDRILAVDGVRVEDYEVCRKLLVGNKGSVVRLKVLRQGEELDFELVRESLNLLQGSGRAPVLPVSPVTESQLGEELRE